MFTNKLVRITNTKTLVNITVRVLRHGTKISKEYFIHSSCLLQSVSHDKPESAMFQTLNCTEANSL